MLQLLIPDVIDRFVAQNVHASKGIVEKTNILAKYFR
jgi:hypothetical protein